MTVKSPLLSKLRVSVFIVRSIMRIFTGFLLGLIQSYFVYKCKDIFATRISLKRNDSVGELSLSASVV